MLYPRLSMQCSASTSTTSMLMSACQSMRTTRRLNLRYSWADMQPTARPPLQNQVALFPPVLLLNPVDKAEFAALYTARERVHVFG